jgi:hypothetical protein
MDTHGNSCERFRFARHDHDLCLDLTVFDDKRMQPVLTPPPLTPAHTQEYSNGKIFLYGGLDGENKPLNDAWLYDVPSGSWELVYAGHSDLVLPTGSLGTLLQGKLVVINAAAGSPKLDIAQVGGSHEQAGHRGRNLGLSCASGRAAPGMCSQYYSRQCASPNQLLSPGRFL